MMERQNTKSIRMELLKLSLFLCFIQGFLFVLFVAFVSYTPKADASNMANSIHPVYGGFNHERYNVVSRFYPMFQDIHVMVFVGFGFLMVFMKKYSYSSVGFSFLLAALVLQWSILCQGVFELNDSYKIEIGLTSLYKADIATATVVISMGAVLGRTSYAQLVIMGVLEIVAFCLNNIINTKYLKAVDPGRSLLVHAFGAYFGLAASYVIARKHKNSDDADPDADCLQRSSWVSNIFAMIGTLFLWVYWPSLNAIELANDKAHRAIINTYLSLTASCVTAFAVSQLSSKDHKFQMVHIQNSTLAGGVAIGACTHLMIQPYGALLIGMLAGGSSVYGYSHISDFIERKFGILDSCGVHNLHGVPGILGGLAAVVMAVIANKAQYEITLFEVYPARSSPVVTHHPEYIRVEPGDGRTAGEQAGFQMLLIVVTVAVAVVSGLLSGLIVNLNVWSNISPELFYNDSVFWELPNAPYDSENPQPVRWRLGEKTYNHNSNCNLKEISL